MTFQPTQAWSVEPLGKIWKIVHYVKRGDTFVDSGAIGSTFTSLDAAVTKRDELNRNLGWVSGQQARKTTVFKFKTVSGS
jgi:hypothetical protein